MSQTGESCPNSRKSEHSEVRIAEAANDRGMGKEERRRVVLEFMAGHQLALPPRAIYRNLRFRKAVTFSYSSVLNYLEEYVEEDLILRIEPKPLEDREVVPISEDENARAYYVITESGIEEANE